MTTTMTFSAAAAAMKEPAETPAEPGPSSFPSLAPAANSSAQDRVPRLASLVLDAAPLLTQVNLQHLAQHFYVTPEVVAELKDKRAKDYVQRLLLEGKVRISVKSPGPEAISKVIAFAKKTGDYSVLSNQDIGVLALTYALEVEAHGTWKIRTEVGGKTGQQKHEAERLAKARQATASTESQGTSAEVKSLQPETLVDEASAKSSSAALASSVADESVETEGSTHNTASEREESAEDDGPAWQVAEGTKPDGQSAAAEDESDPVDDGGSDGEGEWITTDNLAEHQAKSLGLSMATDEVDTSKPLRGERAPLGEAEETVSVSPKSPKASTAVGCMTSDYAVQNVLLQMGLELVSEKGMRIKSVKSWVLRCHACMKLCKDMERKFCPSCGNPTLLRTSVTSKPGGGGVDVHLKRNFQYRNRGTIYSLPLPKPGSASGGKLNGPSAGKNRAPILREDQLEWQRAVAQEKGRAEKEERRRLREVEKIEKKLADAGVGPEEEEHKRRTTGMGMALAMGYEDPDWIPQMMLDVGKGKGRRDQGLPKLGVGRKNPNERRRSRK